VLTPSGKVDECRPLPAGNLGSGQESPACRVYRTPLAQLLDVSGAVAATAWSAGAALLSSYLITGTAAAEAQYGCMCVERYEPAPPPASPQPPTSPPPSPLQSPPPSPSGDAATGGSKELTFTTIATTGDVASYSSKYSGAVAVGSTVYFVPHGQNNVGMLDTVTSSFTTIALTGKAVFGSDRYSGAAAVDNIVYFAPSDQCYVGVFNTTDNSLTTVYASGVRTYPWSNRCYNMYAGAVAVGTKVYFAPGRQNNVGVFDTISNAFNTISTELKDIEGRAVQVDNIKTRVESAYMVYALETTI